MQVLTGKTPSLSPSPMSSGTFSAHSVRVGEMSAQGSKGVVTLSDVQGGLGLPGPDLSNSDSGAATVTGIEPQFKVNTPPRLGEHATQDGVGSNPPSFKEPGLTDNVGRFGRVR